VRQDAGSGPQRRGNLQMLDLKQKDCFAALNAMDGMYAENAGAFFCRKDVSFGLCAAWFRGGLGTIQGANEFGISLNNHIKFV